MVLNELYASGLITWALIHSFETKGMMWFTSSASISEMFPAKAALEKNNPLTKSKIRILKVVKGIIESKKTKDTDNDNVKQSSLMNLFKDVASRLYPGTFVPITRVFIINAGLPPSLSSPVPPRKINQHANSCP
jgi:hypothetical protein